MGAERGKAGEGGRRGERAGARRALALHKGRETYRLRCSVRLRLRHLRLYLQPVAHSGSISRVATGESAVSMT